MRDQHNIKELYDAGIRMMGFIFYERSKRFISVENRQEVFQAIPEDVKKVGVFVNEDLDFVVDTIRAYKLAYVQLHGDEDPKYCAAVQEHTKVIKVFKVDDQFDFGKTFHYQTCDLLLFDARGKEYGGNGIQYDWELLKKYRYETPFLLSGGIGPGDVDKILSFEHHKFIGIDINSGFEVKPGLKNIENIRSFTSYLKCSTQ